MAPDKLKTNGSNLKKIGMNSDSTILLFVGETKIEFPQKVVPKPIIISFER